MRKSSAFGMVIVLTLAFSCLLFLALSARAAPAAGPQPVALATLCVNPGGTAGCYPSIQDAIDASLDRGTVRVAQGIYNETLVMTKSVALEGGWNADFSARDWDAYVTTIDAQGNGSVIQVRGTVSPTIEGFVITGGDGSAYLGWGGGIEIKGEVADDGGTAIIRHNVISDNVACSLVTCQGEGGGIRVGIGTALIEHNTIIGNVARLNEDGAGRGGGVLISGRGAATLIGNTIISNTAAVAPVGPAVGQGGGVYVYGYSGTLIDNEIRGNVAAGDGTGRGGGVYGGGYLYSNRFFSNTASVNGTGYGGAVYAEYVLRFEDNVVLSNTASQGGDGTGGGICALYLRHAYRNTIQDNTAARGGGIYFTAHPDKMMLRDNTVVRNRATGSAGVPPDGGGGIASAAEQVQIIHNQILSNTATGAGGGVLFTAGGEYRLQDNHIVSNTAYSGGGVGVYSSNGTISHNHVISNHALAGGGLYVWGSAQPTLDGNVVLSNTAVGFFAAGGGVMVNVDTGIMVFLTNHIIARNAAGSGGRGGGVTCWQGDCVLVNNTIVDNDRGEHQEGVYLASSGGVHSLWNNIIVGHSTGVDLVAGTVALDYNDYYDNDVDVSGATWGPHHRTDDPQFEDRAGAEYRLAPTSPLIDKAVGSIAPKHDFEGDPRPRGGGADIGADEVYLAEVYVSADAGSDLTGAGTMAEPFASVSRALSEVQSRGTVYVGRGVYSEHITVTRPVDLLGGYRESDWSRDIPANTTTLDAGGMGTVVDIHGAGVEVILEGFTITGGEAVQDHTGGGILVYDGAQATIRYNTITGNHADNAAAGIFVYSADGDRSVVDSNRIYDNVAEGVAVPSSDIGVRSPLQEPQPGGGMLIYGGALIVNNLVYRNTSGFRGDGIALITWDSAIQLLHNTVVRNGGTGGVGVYAGGPAIEMYNNLIVGHGTAISGTQATWDHNGFYDNGARYGPGLSVGLHDVRGAPHFTAPASDDYHIGPGSAGAGRGIDVGVGEDRDGVARPAPAGSAPDMGAYEVVQRWVFLPLAVKQ
jgi:hypothetical protein